MIPRDYSDIIDYNWTGEENREKMPLSLRAKIFAPFSALVGFNDIINNVNNDFFKE